MRGGTAARRLVNGLNGGMAALMRAPVIGPRLRGSLTTVTYVGRRSGRSFTTPVQYQRTGDVVTIGVHFPDAKNWWRNFLDDGAEITLHLDGGDRTGHATVRRDGPRRATVTVLLDPVAS
jgi:hypothetical protein